MGVLKFVPDFVRVDSKWRIENFQPAGRAAQGATGGEASIAASGSAAGTRQSRAK